MKNRNMHETTPKAAAFAICRSVRWLMDAIRTSSEIHRACNEMNRVSYWHMGRTGCFC